MARREWKPGDVAMVADPVHGDRVGLYVAEGRSECWHLPLDGTLRCLAADTPLNARPLVVIDPEDREQVERLCKALRDGDRNLSATSIPAMQAALREFADPKPPIEEPTGKWAVVADANGFAWVRSAWGSEDRQWNKCGTTAFADWDEINAVKVLSEGASQ